MGGSGSKVIRVETGNGSRMFRSTPLEGLDDLRNAVSCKVHVQDDEGYDYARRAWNKDVSGFPSAIVTVESEDDICCVMKYMQNHPNVELGVTGSGRHSHKCAPDNCLLIDCSNLNKKSLDPATGIADFGTGCVLSEVDELGDKHGYAVPLGQNPNTGITGLTMGGGLGILGRSYGLTSDSVLQFRCVLLTGEKVIASADSHPDLFWALRGGGGNFCIVTEIRYQMHKIPDKMAFHEKIYLPIPCVFENPKTAFKRAIHYVENDMPRQSGGNLVLPFGGPFVASFAYNGTPEEGRKHFESPAFNFGRTLIHNKGAKPYSQVQRLALGPGEKEQQAGYYHEKGFICETIPDNLADYLWEASHGKDTPKSGAIIITIVGGKISDLPSDATAYHSRHGLYFVIFLSEWKDPKDAEVCRKWGRRCALDCKNFAFKPYNPPLGEAEAVPDHHIGYEVFNKNLEKLRDIKTKYDPSNRLCHNVNIIPRK
eukprot:TRINITY_DN7294_c0_g2_i1.p1 TRINITY_DN7294_c0_g2~~TRINITY_DN7294_c0_g2_i1.p1  ORF type:complete len:483 (+),score=73.43 TRINITY_DN7294_c0_g2_i1:62-1510(+)